MNLFVKKNKLLLDEFYSIDKYEEKQFWGLNEINLDFLNTFYEKNYILINLIDLIDIKNII